MLGDDNIFFSNTRFSEEAIKQAYLDLGLSVKVVVHDSSTTNGLNNLPSIYKAKFLQSTVFPCLV